MRALVTAEFTDEGQRRLEALGYEVVRAGWGVTRRALAREEYVRAAEGAQLLVTEIEVVDAAVLDALPEVRCVATARGGPVNVDLDACAARGIPVVSTPGRNADSVADFTMGLLLTLCRGIAAGERHLRGSGWLVGDELPYLHFRGPELAGRTLGLVGLGEVGRRVRARAEAGFGMRVLHTDPAVAGSTPLETLLAESDVVSPALPAHARDPGPARRPAPRPAAPRRLPAQHRGRRHRRRGRARRRPRGGTAGRRGPRRVRGRAPAARQPPARGPRSGADPHLAGAAHDVVRHHTDQICTAVERLHAG